MRMDGTSALAPREAELAAAMHGGMSRKQICHAMGITMNTLRNYLSRIYLKLDITSERELVLIVEREKAAAK